MRTAIIVLLAIGLLLGGAWLYQAMQAPVTTGEGPRLATRPAELPGAALEQSFVGAGEEAWVETYSPRTGQLSTRFRAQRFQPRPQGEQDIVDVEQPVAEIHLDDGTIVRIAGQTGRIVLASRAREADPLRQSPQLPSRGVLRDVAVSLHRVEAPDDPPLLTARVNNLAFDNDTFRVATEAYTDADGREIAADAVPVVVRGRDYDFDGRGLVIRWNERDRRLQWLEVAQGERLVIKNTRLLGQEFPLAARASDRFASADGAAPPAGPRPAYRAAFDRDVVIADADAPLASADRMHVDFAEFTSPRDPADGDPSPPATSPSGASTAPPDEPAATTRPARRGELRGPVTVKWNGPLTVQPVEIERPPARGTVTAELLGTASPIRLRRDATEVTAGRLEYRGDARELRLEGSAASPRVLLADGETSRIDTTSLLYSDETRRAVLGAGTAVLAGRAAETGQDLVHARWSDSCRLSFGGVGGDLRRLQSLDLVGDARIEHPRLDLSGGRLEMLFAEPVAADDDSPRLSALLAEQDVRCVLRDAGAVQTLHAGRLEVTTDPVSGAPARVVADSGVRVFNDEERLEARRLDARLSAAAGGQAGEVALQTLLAEGAVSLRGAGGTGASGERLEVDWREGAPRIELRGEPATLTDGSSTLAGAAVRYDARAGSATIDGAGTLQTRYAAAPGAAAVPATATWSRGLTLSADRGEAVLEGDARIVAAAEDGTRNVAESQRIVATLASSPSPATSAGGSRARLAPDDVLGPLRGRTVSAVSLRENVRITSTQQGDDGAVLRRMFLRTERLDYDLLSERLEAPQGGRMLFEDRRPEQGDAAPEDDLLAAAGRSRGATAFQWERSLTYDRRSGLAELSGDVRVVHETLDEPAVPYALAAERIGATLESTPGAPGTIAPATRLRALSADGGVQFDAPSLQFLASQARYDVDGRRLTARGEPGRAGELLQARGLSRGSFDELTLDTRTQDVTLRGFRAAVRE